MIDKNRNIMKLNKNNEINTLEINKDLFNFEKISLYKNDNLIKVSERKHGQIAIISLLSIIFSEIFASHFLLEGKGINLIQSFDSFNIAPFILTIYSIYELSFKGVFPDLKIDNNLINIEVFFGRISMLLITFIFLYEINFENPVITQDLKTIISLIILYFKILFSLNQ